MAFVINETGKRIEFEDYQMLPGIWENPLSTEIVKILDEWFDPAIHSLSFKSSGSTGLAKSIQHSKKSIRESALRTSAYFDYSRGDKSILALPVQYVAGKMMLLRSLVSQLEFILVNISSEPLNEVSYDIDFIAITPHQFMNSFKYNYEQIRKVKKILLGGSALPAVLIDRLEDWPGEVYQSYGMTETLSHVAIRRIDGNAYTKYYNSVSDDISFGIDKDSCLVIYMPDARLGLNTNDHVKLIDSHRFEWLGRRDFIINSGGVKINPERLESHFSGIITQSLFVIPIKHDTLGQRPALVIESGFNEALIHQLKDLNSQLTKIQRLDQLFFLPEFVFTKSGKIDRIMTVKALDNAEKIQL